MKESGFVTESDSDTDRVISRTATLQCKHCGATWIASPGSERIRGWCMKCHGPVCGPRCGACVPFERQMDNIEAGRPEKTPLPEMVSVGGLWLPGDK